MVYFAGQSSVRNGLTGRPLSVQRLRWGVEDHPNRAATGWATLSLQMARMRFTAGWRLSDS